MRMLLWFQACTIAALVVYVLYNKRKSARSKSGTQSAESDTLSIESDKPITSCDKTVVEPPMDERTAQASPSPGSKQELFEQIHHRIISEQLFLDPDFSREHIIRLGLINKNKVALLFRQFANTNFNGYINALRLEYALNMMREQPDVPIKAIAYDAGFNSIRTFYRAFEKVYGKTPAEYKDTLSGNAAKKN